MRFQCTCCGKWHDEIPSYHADRPAPYWDVPEDKRESDVFLTSDSCVIAERFFFVRGLIEIPIVGTSEHFVWGAWVSLKDENFFIWQEHYEIPRRSHIGPFFGWLCTILPVYPSTLHLKTSLHLRDNGVRPRIELHPCNHPLFVEQRDGISVERVSEIIHEIEDKQATN